jgi:hypothetical protein
MSVETYNVISVALGAVTLGAILWYAHEARRTANSGVRQAEISDRIARSASEQAEAPNRPVVVLSTARQLTGVPATVEDGAAAFMLQNETIQLVNIGEGPALDVVAEIVNAGPAPGQLTTLRRVLAAYVRPGEYIETRCTRSELGRTAHLDATYKSVGMVGYRTVKSLSPCLMVREPSSRQSSRRLFPPQVGRRGQRGKISEPVTAAPPHRSPRPPHIEAGTPGEAPSARAAAEPSPGPVPQAAQRA